MGQINKSQRSITQLLKSMMIMHLKVGFRLRAKTSMIMCNQDCMRNLRRFRLKKNKQRRSLFNENENKCTLLNDLLPVGNKLRRINLAQCLLEILVLEQVQNDIIMDLYFKAKSLLQECMRKLRIEKLWTLLFRISLKREFIKVRERHHLRND